MLNKLAPQRDGDLSGSIWSMRRIDYPIHEIDVSEEIAVVSVLERKQQPQAALQAGRCAPQQFPRLYWSNNNLRVCFRSPTRSRYRYIPDASSRPLSSRPSQVTRWAPAANSSATSTATR